MVWGMSMPSGFGDFWPDGEFEFDKTTQHEGWGERLRLYYLAQTPDEQRRLLDYGENHVGYGAGSYGSYVAGKFINEPGSYVYRFGSEEHPCSKPYSPIEPQEVPRSFDTEKSYKTLGSLIKLNNRMLAVDDELKEIIERLEPNMHKFFPIEIRMPRGKVYPAQYYTLVICKYLDSFSPEDSIDGSFSDYGSKYPNNYKPPRSKSEVTGLAFSKLKFGEAHLWRERGFSEWLTCYSDKLQVEIANAGLRIPKHYRVKEIGLR